MIITSLPRSVRTSSIHFDVWWKEFESEIISLSIVYDIWERVFSLVMS